MMERLDGNTYYFPAPTNIGAYVVSNQAVLIDSGNDKDAGRKVKAWLDQEGLSLRLIVNTHSNADHCGGNRYLQSVTGCRIASTRIERSFIEDPILEPSFLYGGFPLGKLQNKFLMAKGSTVTDVIPNSGPILDTGLSAIPLPGHFGDMIGIRTPDDVVFLADSVFSRDILDKYHLFFIYDLGSHLATLRRIETLKGSLFLPSHGSPTADIVPLVKQNLEKIEEIQGVIMGAAKGTTSEDIAGSVARHYGLRIDETQYVLIHSTVRSYLSYLSGKGKVGYSFDGGSLRWSVTV